MHSIGIDLGGSKIAAVLMNEQGRVLKEKRIATPQSKKAIITALRSLIESLKTAQTKGVGMGCPGFVKPDGRLAMIHNVSSLMNVNLRKELRLPLVVANDAKCFALAEHMYGAGKGTKNMIGVVWGTGIGAGIIVNNQLLMGAQGAAGEIGHTIIDPGAKNRCTCGRYGDWESLCAGPQLLRQYTLLGGKFMETAIILKSTEDAAKIVKKTALEYMSIGIANLIMVFNPEKVVLGGGLSNLDVYPELNRLVRKRVGKDFSCVIVKNKMGDSAGKIGAASLVFTSA